MTLNGNFIDTCLLDWCKIFGDLRAAHHWAKVVTDEAQFLPGLAAATRLDEPAFERYRIEVRTYRDKFVAHLDDLNNAQVPTVQPAIDSARYLYDYLLQHENDVDAFLDAPASANRYYQQHLAFGRQGHKS